MKCQRQQRRWQKQQRDEGGRLTSPLTYRMLHSVQIESGSSLAFTHALSDSRQKQTRQ